MPHSLFMGKHKPMNERQRYLSYLLRMWQTSDETEQIWRASLEVPGTGERQGFASLDELFDFLRTRTEPLNEQERLPPTGRRR
jgi:hypothetical protein